MFIYDTPARSYIKNTVAFNAAQGCLLCKEVGAYSNRRMAFPRCNAAPRTDLEFREKSDFLHHKGDSPLEQLPIDMVKDITTADDLHLLHLGITKQLLVAWVASKKKIIAATHRWSPKVIANVNEFLLSNRLPTEIHRSNRSLEYLKMWKGLEFRNFLNYTGIVALRAIYDEYSPEYKMFCNLFVGCTICNMDEHHAYLPLAHKTFMQFIEQFKLVFNSGMVTSNIHQACHIVSQVERFGPLQKMSSYPFENELHRIKRKIRAGSNPLQQLVRRLMEEKNRDIFENRGAPKGTILLTGKSAEEMCIVSNTIVKKFYSATFGANVIFKCRDLCNDCWFLTQLNDVIKIYYCFEAANEKKCVAKVLLEKRNLFSYPMDSEHFNVYLSDGKLSDVKLLTMTSLKCKMVRLVLLAIVYCAKNKFFCLYSIPLKCK